jgi:hypothetical protein
VIRVFVLFLLGTSSLQPCEVALKKSIQELRLRDQWRVISKSFLHLFSERLHTGADASASGAPAFSFGFP